MISSHPILRQGILGRRFYCYRIPSVAALSCEIHLALRAVSLTLVTCWTFPPAASCPQHPRAVDGGGRRGRRDCQCRRTHTHLRSPGYRISIWAVTAPQSSRLMVKLVNRRYLAPLLIERRMEVWARQNTSLLSIFFSFLFFFLKLPPKILWT